MSLSRITNSVLDSPGYLNIFLSFDKDYYQIWFMELFLYTLNKVYEFQNSFRIKSSVRVWKLNQYYFRYNIFRYLLAKAAVDDCFVLASYL